MTPDCLVVTRTPTVRFVREQLVEPGTRVWLYWNGSRAPNGDGVPGGEAAISYAAAIHPSAAGLPLHLRGHTHLFGGRFGSGGFGEPAALLEEAAGFGTGPFGLGPLGIGAGWWTWKFPFPLRDGDYRLAVKLGDELGNIQADEAAATMVLRVLARPRPPSRLALSFDGDALTASWEHSPEFAATE